MGSCSGVLLYGPPGTGKFRTCFSCNIGLSTLYFVGKGIIARGIANDINFVFISIDFYKVISTSIQCGIDELRSAFSKAEKQKSLLFLDNIHFIAQIHEKNLSPEERKLLAVIITSLETLASQPNIQVVASSSTVGINANCLKYLCNRIFICRPNLQSRIDILKLITSKLRLSLHSDVKVEKLAGLMKDKVGGEINVICSNAYNLAQNSPITMADFKKVMQNEESSESSSDLSQKSTFTPRQPVYHHSSDNPWYWGLCKKGFIFFRNSFDALSRFD